MDRQAQLRRGIKKYEKLCKKCKGWGAILYGHGSTWRGGVGVCRGAWDICNECWGSGTPDRVWVNLKNLFDRAFNLPTAQGSADSQPPKDDCPDEANSPAQHPRPQDQSE